MQNNAKESYHIRIYIQVDYSAQIDSQLDVTAFPSSKIKMLFRRLKQIFSIQ